MNIRDLATALAARDALAARAWMLEARRHGFDWSTVELPFELSELELAIAAAVVELVALREGASPPAWTASIPALSGAPVYLVKAAETMPRLRLLCEEHGPEPLRRRKLFAPPEFLTAA